MSTQSNVDRDNFRGFAAAHRNQSRFPLRRSESMSTASLATARARLETATEKRKGNGDREPYYGSFGEPEEVIDAVPSTVHDLVTRNHYGCLVLNAARALFIDIDVMAPSEIVPATSKVGHSKSPWKEVLDDLRVVLANEKDEGFRIYRTAAGFRILATTHEFEPGSRQSDRLMNAVSADAAFVDLCRIQNSFRARLTPKPWRCGLLRPPNAFPRHTAEEMRRFADWLEQYERACRPHATCRYVGHVGPNNTHKRVATVIEFHDRETKALASLQLA